MSKELSTKLSKLRAHMAAGDWTRAILLAAKFQELGEHKAAILKAREGLLRPSFQMQLGKDPGQLVAAGITALKERYHV